MKKVILIALSALLLCALFAACAPAAAEPTATPGEAVIAEPTAAAEPTPTEQPEPTPTPAAPASAELPSIESDDWAYETIGTLHLEMAKDALMSALGEPEKMGEAQVWGIDGRTYQTYSYAKKGVELILAWEPDQPETATVYRYTVKLPYDGKTPRGIGVGSTKDEVMAAYKDGYNPEENHRDTEIIIGSIYGGILFSIKDNVVESVSFGAFAE